MWVKYPAEVSEVGGALVSLYHGKDIRFNRQAWEVFGWPEALTVHHNPEGNLLGFAPAQQGEPGSFAFWSSANDSRTARIDAALEAFDLAYQETSRAYRPKLVLSKQEGDPTVYVELEQPVRVGGSS